MSIVLEKDMYVTLYKVEEVFGGHEEGGWCYDCYTPIASVKGKESEAYKTAEQVEKACALLDESIGRIEVFVENVENENQTVKAPYYE